MRSQSVEAFVQDIFSPMVAVLCSHDADQVCRKNNLTFVDLIQPFCVLKTEVHIRDVQNVSHPIHDLKILVRDMNDIPPQNTLARKAMHEAVLNTQGIPEDDASITHGDYSLKVNEATSWYDAFRETFLELTLPSNHEFSRHFLACIFIVSSHHPEPLEHLNRLGQQQHAAQHQTAQPPKPYPKWFSPNVFKYYVLLHDIVDGEESRADAIYQSMKSTYGAHACHLLQINSRTEEHVFQNPSDLPNAWSHLENKEKFSDILSKEVRMSLLHEKLSTLARDHPLSADGEEGDLSGRRRTSSGRILPPLPRIPEAKGAFLTLTDLDRIRVFIHEFCTKGLLPYVERQMRHLGEQFVSRNKVGRPFSNFARRWFRPASAATTTSSPPAGATVANSSTPPGLM